MYYCKLSFICIFEFFSSLEFEHIELFFSTWEFDVWDYFFFRQPALHLNSEKEITTIIMPLQVSLDLFGRVGFLDFGNRLLSDSMLIFL
ncbi:hypothetical protein RCL_jg4823.t1 [Rhizophagus clarus]|uniref:Uncharacterized protein n=1 Tax=Rhizophagus clarus TaxID=94130 RepID=A0A8H3R663_9GLOM|nr:hypothetical protein RCL_jg4823.t1 [Rhizophagus clarus]